MVHVKSNIFKKIGQKPDIKNDEFEAYLTGYLVERLTHFYQECKKLEEAKAPGQKVMELDFLSFGNEQE